MVDRFVGQVEALVGALTSRRRRYALYVLRESDRPVPVETVARLVAAREAGVQPEAVPEERRRAVARALVAVHLPGLAATGVVTYDPVSRLAALSADRPLLDAGLSVLARVDGVDDGGRRTA